MQHQNTCSEYDVHQEQDQEAIGIVAF
jgi:hypothetical protein